MGRFDTSIATAQRLIKLNGQLVTWRSLTDDSDADKPWNSNLTPGVDHDNIPIVFLRNKRQNQQSDRYDKLDDLPIGSYYGLMGAVNFTPTVKDVVIRDGKELRVLSVDTLDPNGQVIIYTVRFDT